MNLFFVFHGGAILGSLVLGAAVFLNNPKRSTNRCYLLLSLTLAVWLVSMGMAFMLRSPAGIAAAIKGACASGLLIPLGFNWLRLAIMRPDLNVTAIVLQARLWGLSTLCMAFLCSSDRFIRGVFIPPDGGIPEPRYGAFFYVYTPYLIGGLLYMAHHFMRDVRRSRGIRRSELEFVLLGSGIGLFLSVLFTVVIPLITGSSQFAQLAGVAAVIFHSIIAYGIATRRILDVAHVLRRMTAAVLLTLYLIALYSAVFGVVSLIVRPLPAVLGSAAHLAATLAVAFSMTPAHGWMQRFAALLLVSRRAPDAGQTIKQASAVLQSIGTLDTLLERFCKVIGDAVGTDSVTILTANDASFSRVYPAAEEDGGGGGLDGGPASTLVFGRDDPLARLVEQLAHPVVPEAILRAPLSGLHVAALERLQALRAHAAVPIRFRGTLTGIMLLGPRLSGRFYGTPEQEALLGAAEQLAVSMENAKLYTAVQDGKVYNDILLDNLVSGVVAVNLDRTITVFNREAQRVTRLPADRMLNARIEALPAPLVAIVQHAFETGSVVRNEDLVLRHGEHDEIPVQASSRLFHSAKGDVLGVLVVFDDMTVVKRLESQVRRAAHLASLGTISAGMAHEIKNPLVTLKTFVQLLPERYEDEEFRQTFCPLLEKEINRIDGIVTQLLHFARPAKPQLSTTGLNGLLEQCLRLVRARLARTQVEVVRDLVAQPDLILGDPALLESAFVNLLVNAIDAMDSQGVLTVRTRLVGVEPGQGEVRKGGLSGPAVRVSLQDTGMGISPQNLSKIFDPFFTTKSKGTGLGLSVAHGILQEHRAVIDVESVPGAGTVFHITFPVIAGPGRGP